MPRASWQELVAVKGLQFYTQQPSGAGHIRFGYPLPSLTDAEYHKQIVWLACEIRDFLNVSESSPRIELTNPSTLATVASALHANATSDERSTPAVLWIADTTPELAGEKRDLIQAVRQAGFAVITADIDEILGSPHQVPLTQLKHGLAKATLIVQMVSIEVGEYAPDHRSWARFQADLAMKVAHERGVPYVRWRRPGASLDSVADPLHRELLTGAIEQRMEELRSDVVKRLQLLSEPVAKDEPKALQNGPSVCISYTEDDLKVVAGVEEMLRELNVDYVGFQSPSRFDSATDADRHCADEDRAIAESAGVIIVYGKAAREWLTTKIMRANQLRGRRRQQWGALVDAPSPGKIPAPIASSMRRLDWHAGPRIDLMKQFVESLVGSAHV